MIVVMVMVLQRLEGLSDREAVDRFAFDVRWKYAAGGLDFDHPRFVHTVLVDMRARLAASDRPGRIFERTVQVAAQAGLVGRRRVLDSAPIYDAVATQDTLTLIRSAIRGLLRAADRLLRVVLRAVISSGDGYTDLGKPVIDWTDAAEREALIDSRARDGFALLAVLDGRKVAEEVDQAARLLATVLGQDLDQGEDGVFRIARKVAGDRIVSTVDPEARHGRKTVSKSFDGYKGQVYGDAAYGTGPMLARLSDAGIEALVKTQSPNAPGGRFTKDAFAIDLEAGQVSCPNQVTTEIRRHRDGGGVAAFGAACASCPLAEWCTTAENGREIKISPHEEHLLCGRANSADPGWLARYRATRPSRSNARSRT